jgi:hypothetical protein
MKWIKKGLIYCADHTSDWAITHAAIPTPYLLNDRTLRIYCSFRAEKNVSRIGYVDVLADNPKEIIDISAKPALDIGQPGAFDDNGVIPLSIIANGKALYLYYGGFQLGVQVPYFHFGGLAISTDGGSSFVRHQQTPVLDRKGAEFFLRVTHQVMQENGVWKLWYLAGSEWIVKDGKKLPLYTVKYMESPDGINWNGNSHTCLHLKEDEHGFGRVYVAKNDCCYQMYYSIRSLSKGYRLGYAESEDGKDWVRKDELMGLDVSTDGWDSESVCYSAVITHHGKTYLFYNGNGYGETGFGYAELVP